jgi:hypothetical protein
VAPGLLLKRPVWYVYFVGRGGMNAAGGVISFFQFNQAEVPCDEKRTGQRC